MTVFHLDPKQHAWLQGDAVTQLIGALRAGGAMARFVGGCVRDAVLGRKCGEIDLAVNVPPERCEEILQKAGIKCVRTGFEHGTLTAVIDGKGYEITSLRRDVKTDGRRAVVSYTEDWREDAMRRDFTMNALYAEQSGAVEDFFGGIEDAQQGRVRFIGAAEDRIREDVLRILRFFRFHAHIGRGDPDPGGLAACAKLAGLMPQLSAERIWQEMKKLLAADDPAPTLALMRAHGVLQQILPEAKDLAVLKNLVAREKKFSLNDPVRRLAALLPCDADTAAQVAARWRLSNHEQARLVQAARDQDVLDMTEKGLRALFYRLGAESSRDRLLLTADIDETRLARALNMLETWEKPAFPLTGHDLMKAGVKEGPALGETLRALEQWWIDRDFAPSREECLAELGKIKK